MEFGNALPHDINISGSGNKGFIVRVGCCTAVFTDKKEMLNAIEDYINDPKKMEKAYNESNQGPTCFNANAPVENSLRITQEDCCQEERSRR